MCAYTSTFQSQAEFDMSRRVYMSKGPSASGYDKLRAMTKRERIDQLKAELLPIAEWLDAHRSQQRELPNYETNRGRAHELRKQLCQLRDPELFARVYQ
jgi:hypothetical protein